MKSSRGRRARGIALLLIAEAAAVFLIGEALVAYTRLDLKLLSPLLYYQSADLPVHRPSDDVALHYELRPGASASFSDPVARRVTINDLGFRDEPRDPVKPARTFRIVCLGGSNTYGGLVDDAATYPRLLEAELDSRGRRRFEVWNAGVSAYVLTQSVRQAEIILEKYSPDLLIFQLTNTGRRAFLQGYPIGRYFDQDSGLYRENLRYWPKRPSTVLERSRLLRALAIAANLLFGKPVQASFPRGDPQEPDGGLAALRAFYAKNHDRVKIAVMNFPGSGDPPDLHDIGAPFIDLRLGIPVSNDPEYFKIHPQAYVYRWYARKIAAGLKADGLLP